MYELYEDYYGLILTRNEILILICNKLKLQKTLKISWSLMCSLYHYVNTYTTAGECGRLVKMSQMFFKNQPNLISLLLFGITARNIFFKQVQHAQYWFLQFGFELQFLFKKTDDLFWNNKPNDRVLSQPFFILMETFS